MWLSYILLSVFFCFDLIHEISGLKTAEETDNGKWVTTMDVIIRNGYPVEEHAVHTEDGYILTMHRIPHGKNVTDNNGKRRGAFYLQHGVIGASINFVTDLPRPSLAFTLADEGFDVWLGNTRGNEYSRKHEFYPENSDEYWDFSQDEMAIYDLTGMVNYVLKAANQSQLYYVGHSQGTLIAFARLSDDIEFQKKIKAVFALAPVTRLKNIHHPIKRFGRNCLEMKTEIDKFHITHLAPYIPYMRLLHELKEFICLFFRSLKYCNHTKPLVKDIVPLLPSNLSRFNRPYDTGVKNLWHYAQLVDTGLFQKYDYGIIGNLVNYFQVHPPVHDIRNVKVPVVLFSGGKDKVSAQPDVKWINKQLPNVLHNIYLPNYGHDSFLWHKTVYEKVYHPIAMCAKNEIP